jgi:hypothetical protein
LEDSKNDGEKECKGNGVRMTNPIFYKRNKYILTKILKTGPEMALLNIPQELKTNRYVLNYQDWSENDHN